MNNDTMYAFNEHVFNVTLDGLNVYNVCSYTPVYIGSSTLANDGSVTIDIDSIRNDAFESTDLKAKHIVNTNIFSLIKHWASMLYCSSYWVYIKRGTVYILFIDTSFGTYTMYYVCKAFKFTSKAKKRIIEKFDKISIRFDK